MVYSDCKLITIGGAYTNFENLGGIFDANPDITFCFNNDIDINFLSEMFLDKYSERLCAPIITKRLNDDCILPTNARAHIAKYLYVMYNNVWDKLLDTCSVQYDFLNPYNITQTLNETRNGTQSFDTDITSSGSHSQSQTNSTDASNSQTNSHTINTTDTTTFGKVVTSTDTQTITDSHTQETETEKSVSDNSTSTSNTWAFNSTTKTPVNDSVTSLTNSQTDNQTTTYSANDSHSQNGSVTDSGTEKLTSTGTNSDNISISIDEDSSSSQTATSSNTQNIDSSKQSQFSTIHTLTKKGNLGSLPFQQLIEHQRRIVDFNFWDKVFRDVCKALSIPIF